MGGRFLMAAAGAGAPSVSCNKYVLTVLMARTPAGEAAFENAPYSYPPWVSCAKFGRATFLRSTPLDRFEPVRDDIAMFFWKAGNKITQARQGYISEMVRRDRPEHAISPAPAMWC